MYLNPPSLSLSLSVCHSLCLSVSLSLSLSLSLSCLYAEPHGLRGSVADSKTGGRWFDPRLAQYSFRELMIVITPEFIPLSPLSVVSTMVTCESSQWLGKNTV